MANAPAGRAGPGQAALLTFLAAACVLVLEIAAGRLLAPYVGVSLLTYTGIIGVILAGIALGAWLGGKAADAYGPLTLLGPTFVVGGLTAMAAVPIVDVVGALDIGGGGIGTIVLLSTIGFVAPAAVLSAVAPMIVRATISDLTTSGSSNGAAADRPPPKPADSAAPGLSDAPRSVIGPNVTHRQGQMTW